MFSAITGDIYMLLHDFDLLIGALITSKGVLLRRCRNRNMHRERERERERETK
jgi:hypothetical protein